VTIRPSTSASHQAVAMLPSLTPSALSTAKTVAPV
jgi:hypothetical protein